MILMEKNGKKSLTEKISVIIPSCNRSSYLSRAIKSVINQNYDNVEIIIINDASTDDTKEMVASFKYKNIVYIENKVRMGANFCRNVGLKKASGEFISFLDDDDYFSEIDKIEQQLNMISISIHLAIHAVDHYSVPDVPKAIGKYHTKLSAKEEKVALDRVWHYIYLQLRRNS